MKTGSDEAAGGCLMFRAVWATASGNRSLIGVVLGQRGDDLITAALYAAKRLVDRLAPNAAAPDTSSMPAPSMPVPRHTALPDGLSAPSTDETSDRAPLVRLGRLPTPT